MSWFSQYVLRPARSAFNWFNSNVMKYYDPNMIQPPVPSFNQSSYQTSGAAQTATTVRNSVNAAARQAAMNPIIINQVAPTMVQPTGGNEGITLVRSNPDDQGPGALAGGGNQALQLAPLGVRGAGGYGRTTLLGA